MDIDQARQPFNMEVIMSNGKKSNDNEKELTSELETEAQQVDPTKTTEQLSGSKIEIPKESEPDEITEQPTIDREMVSDFTTGIVKSLDVVQTRICLTLSRQQHSEENKKRYSFDKEQQQALVAIWQPVLFKWYKKIPLEIMAVVITAGILSENFARAKSEAIEIKK